MADQDQQLREILLDSKPIAVVGIKDDASQDTFRVPKYLQENGVDFDPVNPKVDSILGERSFAPLADVDLVNRFRAPENIPGHVSEALAMGKPSKAVWMQREIYHGQPANGLRAAGIAVIQDPYIMLDPRHLTGATKAAN